MVTLYETSMKIIILCLQSTLFSSKEYLEKQLSISLKSNESLEPLLFEDEFMALRPRNALGILPRAEPKSKTSCRLLK